LPPRAARGNNLGIVAAAGRKRVVIWGAANLGLDNLEQLKVAVRGIPMARVPAGKFNLKLVPGAGHDQSKTLVETADLPAYYLARCETTLAMYADFLNEPGRGGAGWHEKMSHAERCGIEKGEDGKFRVLAGRERYPVTYVSWYNATAFLEWCGLRLPTEAEFVKAMRGGLFLDGDASKQKPNPLPDRKYAWGSEAPDEGGVWRCNVDGEPDGYGYTAPVGSFARFNSPYGICDLVGNVAEWTLDWYATSYHAGLDGYRMVRGGSWMEAPATCDGTTGATSLPIKESGIVGFRAACDGD
jgi:formylglycine-generating enzyme required for sulfatase activity